MFIKGREITCLLSPNEHFVPTPPTSKTVRSRLTMALLIKFLNSNVTWIMKQKYGAVLQIAAPDA